MQEVSHQQLHFLLQLLITRSKKVCGILSSPLAFRRLAISSGAESLLLLHVAHKQTKKIKRKGG